MEQSNPQSARMTIAVLLFSVVIGCALCAVLMLPYLLNR